MSSKLLFLMLLYSELFSLVYFGTMTRQLLVRLVICLQKPNNVLNQGNLI